MYPGSSIIIQYVIKETQRRHRRHFLGTSDESRYAMWLRPSVSAGEMFYDTDKPL